MTRARGRGGATALGALAAVACASACSSLEGLSSGADAGSDAPSGAPDATTDGAAPPADAARDAADAPRDAASGDAGCGNLARPGTSSLVDDFASGFAPNWNPIGGCIVETGGEMVASPPAYADASNGYCFAYTASTYRLSCDTLTMKVPQVTAQTFGVQTFIYLDTFDGAQRASVILEGGGFVIGGPSGQVASGAYDSLDVWWRVRESGGQLAFETSRDGTTWTTRAEAPDPIPLDDVRVTIGAGVHAPLANPGSAHFRCYNVAPANCR